jgi:hypothetical protein
VETSGIVAMRATHGQADHSWIATQARRSAGVGDGRQSVPTSVPFLLGWGDNTCLPSGVEQLLAEVVTDGFVIYCCGPRGAPRALVASYRWDDYVDVLSIRCFDRIITARVAAPQHGGVDVFDPKTVVWAYEGPPQPALQALLDLVPPDHPDAPTRRYPAPPGLYIPRSEQRPLTIRLPPPHCASHRADRLAVTTADQGHKLTPASDGHGLVRRDDHMPIPGRW